MQRCKGYSAASKGALGQAATQVPEITPMTDPNGAANINGNIDPINIPPMLLVAYIYQHHGIRHGT